MFISDYCFDLVRDKDLVGKVVCKFICEGTLANKDLWIMK